VQTCTISRRNNLRPEILLRNRKNRRPAISWGDAMSVPKPLPNWHSHQPPTICPQHQTQRPTWPSHHRGRERKAGCGERPSLDFEVCQRRAATCRRRRLSAKSAAAALLRRSPQISKINNLRAVIQHMSVKPHNPARRRANGQNQ
jgi:hypothetical protein